jgi:hypothetical protein
MFIPLCKGIKIVCFVAALYGGLNMYEIFGVSFEIHIVSIHRNFLQLICTTLFKICIFRNIPIHSEAESLNVIQNSMPSYATAYHDDHDCRRLRSARKCNA